MKSNLTKKSQGLPLNTIVLAILVILVLVVIIFFFLSNFGKTALGIQNQSPTVCSSSNPVITTLGITNPTTTKTTKNIPIPGIPGCYYTPKK